ncbi:MAG: hypothetical protein AB7F19_03025 [Candidatus Babeliales bacterium]
MKLFITFFASCSLAAMDPTSPRLRRDTNHAISPRSSLGVAGAPEERRRMDAPSTINPKAHPQAFFSDLDARILATVQNAQVACEQHSRDSMLNNLAKLSELLTLAQTHKDDFLSGYEKNHSAGTKRTHEVMPSEMESLNNVMAFRLQTQSLITAFQETAHEEISPEEWHLMSKLFKAFNPVNDAKKSRPDSQENK